MSGVIIGVAVSAVGVGLSAQQAGKQNRLRLEAERETEKAMERARKTLAVNFMEGRSLPKEAYEQAREGIGGTVADTLTRAQEADPRGLSAAAGRAVMASQIGERQIAAAQEERLFQLDTEARKEDARLQGLEYQLELGGVTGAQQAQADAVAAQQRAIGQAAQGLGQLGGTLLKNEDINPLYARAKGQDLLPNSKAVVDRKAFQDQIQSPTTRPGLFQPKQINPIFGTDSFQQIQNPLFNPQMDMYATPFDSVTGLS
jgi:gas vesicle protein